MIPLIEDPGGGGCTVTPLGPWTIGEVYRVPNTKERESITHYEHLMTKLCDTKCEIIMGTDQNFDFMKINNNNNISDLLDVFYTLGVIPTTRITHTSATLIDNIYVKSDKLDSMQSRTRQSEMANTSPCHIPVLGNVPPIFVVTSFLCSLEFLYF